MQNKQALLRNIIFIFIVAVQIAICIHYAKYKTNLFVDEIWTFNLANNYYSPFIGSAAEYMNRWIDSKFWLQVLSVQPGEEFSYGSVFYNQAQDVHPPLYYMIIHTVCSFFPQQFSIWFGVVPNLFFFIGTQIILIKISNKLFEDKWIAILPCVIYGFSWGGINSVIFIRMYMLLTFFAVFSFFIHMLLWEYYNNYAKLKAEYLIILFLITICGFLTQYYYAVFAFFMFLLLSLSFFIKKDYNAFFKYILINVSSLITAIAIFPAFLQQMFSGYRGVEAINNFYRTQFWDRFKAFIKILNDDMFGELLLFIIILFAIYCIIKLILFFVYIRLLKIDEKYIIKIQFHKLETEYILEFSQKDLVFIGIFVIVSGVFLVTVKIAPFLENRYIYILYPFISLLIFKCFYSLVYNILKTKIISIVLVLLFITISCINMYNADNLKFSGAWKNYKNISRILKEEYPGINGIFVATNNDWHPSISQIIVFSETKQTFFMTVKDISMLNDILVDYQKKHEAILIYMTYHIKDKTKIINEITENTVYKHYKEIDSNHGKTFLFTKSV